MRQKHATDNAEAYELYVKGRFYLEQRTHESIYKALDQLNQAIAKDSKLCPSLCRIGGCLHPSL